MICPFCQAETDGVNHNNRGLRCTACWALLPSMPEPTPIKRTRKPRKKEMEE